MLALRRWLCALAVPLAIAQSSPAQDVIAFEPLQPRLTVRQDFGNGVGYPNGFTYGQGWIPFFSTPGQSTGFLDVRLSNFEDIRLWEYNLGGGYRWYGDTFNRVNGVNMYYDGRTTDSTTFHQLGWGFESLGQYFDVRGNYYLPIATTSQQLGETVGNPQFSAFNILLDRTILTQTALRGFDLEAGVPIPVLNAADPRAFLGYYHYDGEGNAPSIDGIRGRFEANYNNRLSLHFQVSHDNYFDTTVTGGLAFHIGGRPGARDRYLVQDRMDARVVRDVNIVLAQDSKTTQEAAIDPKTGQPIVVYHANSNAAAGGDGSVERPFQSLTQLQTGSTPNSILFLHAGSTFTQQSLALQNGQRLLGEGIAHQFVAQQGTFLLPRATDGTALPILLRTGGASNTITLAMDNEVSGLDYRRTGGTGGFIFGTGNLGAFDINRNIGNGGPNLVNFVNVSGDGIISGNSFTTGSVTSGIILTQSAGNLRMLIENNQIKVGSVASGILVTQTGGSAVVLGIRNNQFTTGAVSAAVTDTVVGGGASQLLLLQNNTSTGGGYLLTGAAGALFRVENVLGTNSPAPTTAGVTLVPAGTAGFSQ